MEATRCKRLRRPKGLGFNHEAEVKKTLVVRSTVMVVSVEKEVAGGHVTLAGDGGLGVGNEKPVENWKESTVPELTGKKIAKLLSKGESCDIPKDILACAWMRFFDP